MKMQLPQRVFSKHTEHIFNVCLKVAQSEAGGLFLEENMAQVEATGLEAAVYNIVIEVPLALKCFWY